MRRPFPRVMVTSFGRLPDADPQLQGREQGIENHHVEVLPRIEELRPVDPDRAHQGDRLEQGDLGIDQKHFFAVVDNVPGRPDRGGLPAGLHLVAHVIAHGLVRVWERPGGVQDGHARGTLRRIVPAHDPHRRLRHTLAGDIVGPTRRGDGHAIGQPSLGHGDKHMRPEPVPRPVPALLHFPPARLALFGRGPVAIDDLPHLLARLQDNVQGLAEGDGHLHRHARGIVIDFLGGPGRDLGAADCWPGAALRLHQLGDGPGGEVLDHRDHGRGRGLAGLAARHQTHPEHKGPHLHTVAPSLLWGHEFIGGDTHAEAVIEEVIHGRQRDAAHREGPGPESGF